MRSKESFTFVAAGPLSAGFNVALVGYTLAPEASLDEMAAEVHSALDWLAGELPALGVVSGRICLSGWSAGAHLAVGAINHPSVQGCLAISGIYDLEPIRFCYVNDKLGLDEAAARRNSPIHHLPLTSPPLTIAVGATSCRSCSVSRATMRRPASHGGLPVVFCEVPGADHFTILDEIARPDGRLTAILRNASAAM